MKRNLIIVSSIITIIVIIIGWWLASPLFIDKVVNEQLPGTASDSSNEINDNLKTNMRIEFQGSFVDADSFHKTSGKAKVVVIEGKRYLSMEDFQTTNGPDLYVYLSKDKEAKEFINLGRLKGNIGAQNYEIPEDIDLNSYNKVLIWCRAFKVLFGSAELN